MKRVAIIGAGASGILVALNLLRDPTFQGEVLLFDKTGSFTQGLAYGTHSKNFFLNVPADVMGPFPEAPTAFYEWCKDNKLASDPKAYLPRFWYSEYLQELVKKSQALKPFQQIQSEVLGINKAIGSSRYILTLEDSANVTEVDYVVLALGNIATPFSVNKKPIEDALSPTNLSSFEGIEKRSSIAIIGSGLSAVDVVLEAVARKFNGRFSIISPHGELPQIHTESHSASAKQRMPTSARALAREFHHSVKSGTAADYINALRPQLPTIWKGFNNKEKGSFIRHLRHYWENHRHRMPPTSAATLSTLQKQEKLSLIAGRVRSLTKKGSLFELQIKTRGHKSSMQSVSADVVFNCTGFSSQLASTPSLLLSQLRDQGQVIAGSCGIGIDVDTQYRVLNSARDPQTTLYALGPILRGALWETTAIREIRQQAHRIAQEIVSSSSSPGHS